MSDEAVVKIVLQDTTVSMRSVSQYTGGTTTQAGGTSSLPTQQDFRLYREMTKSVVEINKGFKVVLDPVVNLLKEIKDVIKGSNSAEIIGPINKIASAMVGRQEEEFFKYKQYSFISSIIKGTLAAVGLYGAFNVARNVYSYSGGISNIGKEIGGVAKEASQGAGGVAGQHVAPIEQDTEVLARSEALSGVIPELTKSLMKTIGNEIGELIADNPLTFTAALIGGGLGGIFALRNFLYKEKVVIKKKKSIPELLEEISKNTRPVEGIEYNTKSIEHSTNILCKILEDADAVLQGIATIAGLMTKNLVKPTGVDPLKGMGEERLEVIPEERLELVPPKHSGPNWPEQHQQTPQEAMEAGSVRRVEREEEQRRLTEEQANVELTPPDYRPLRPDPVLNAPIELDNDTPEVADWHLNPPPRRKFGAGTTTKVYQQLVDAGVIPPTKRRTEVNAEDIVRYKEMTGKDIEYAKGGLARGTDTIPAMLSPGEVVVPKDMVDGGAVDHLRGKLPGFADGGQVEGRSWLGFGKDLAVGTLGAARVGGGAAREFATTASADTGDSMKKFGAGISAMGDKLSLALPMIGGFIKGIGAAGEALGGMIQAVNDVAERYGEYSGEIAQAQAVAEIRQTMGDFRRAQEVSGDLAKFIIAQSDLQQRFEDMKIKILSQILPTIVKMMEILEEAMPEGGNIEAAITALAAPLVQIAGAVDEANGIQRDAKIPDVLDPTDVILGTRGPGAVTGQAHSLEGIGD